MEESKQGKRKLHRGWWIIITTFIIMVLVYAPSVSMGGLFVVPISEAQGVTRTAVALGSTLAFFASIPICIFAGKIMNLTKIRYVEAIVLGFTVISWILPAVFPSLTMYYICMIVRGLASPMCPMIALSILSDRWFGPKARGRALGIATVGSGLGQMILNPIVAGIIEKYGWRTGYIFFAVLAAIVIPLVLATWGESPEEYGLERIGEADPDDPVVQQKVYGPTLKKVLTSPFFWFAFIGMVLSAGGSQTTLTLGASFFQTAGFSAVTAATFLTFGSFGIMIGKLFLGTVIDKLGVQVGIPLGGILMAVGYGGMMLGIKNPVFMLMAVFAFVWGMGCAVINLAIPLFSSVLVGTRSYPVVVSLIQMATSLGAGTLPTLFSSTYEKTGNYYTAWTGAMIVSICFAVIAIICIGVRKKHPASEITE
ncbi:MAG: MFS transporter [Eubacterium sp.]|nr:MFS transporter [Eubacterium sp.]